MRATSSTKLKCFLDFDHTLFQTDEFFHVDLREAFMRQGMDAKEWEASYAAVWPTGFTFEKLAEELARRGGGTLPVAKMKSVVRESFSDLRRYLFPDVLPFLDRARERGVKLYLISFGNPEWQQQKALGCGIIKSFREMFFVQKQEGKAGAVEAEMRGFSGQAVVVDNNSADLDLIRDKEPEARTYWMNRVPDKWRVPVDDLTRRRFLEARKYLEYVPRYTHIVCHNLDEVEI